MERNELRNEFIDHLGYEKFDFETQSERYALWLEGKVRDLSRELSKLHQPTVVCSVCKCEPRTRFEIEKEENECSDCGLPLFIEN